MGVGCSSYQGGCAAWPHGFMKNRKQKEPAILPSWKTPCAPGPSASMIERGSSSSKSLARRQYYSKSRRREEPAGKILAGKRSSASASQSPSLTNLFNTQFARVVLVGKHKGAPNLKCRKAHTHLHVQLNKHHKTGRAAVPDVPQLTMQCTEQHRQKTGAACRPAPSRFNNAALPANAHTAASRWQPSSPP
jgi:hypothetical protein